MILVHVSIYSLNNKKYQDGSVKNESAMTKKGHLI